MNLSQKILLNSLAAGLLASNASMVFADANPVIPFYGGAGVITASPAYPIVGENTHFTVIVGNSGDQTATGVQVRISFNDWGVSFQGWQEVATVTIPSIPAGGTATAEADFVFQNRTHTCLEAVIVGANQNSNPNDDRGQINLEVINAGETFTYWVPVVNNGDVPLDLLLIGGCKGGRPPQGDAGGPPCEQNDQRVHVEPGEELLIPVQIDLRAFAVGEEIVFVLDAFDLGAANPFLPQNHNHVELRIKKQSARSLKQQAVAKLSALASGIPEKNLRKQVENATKHVEKALRPGDWTDDNQIKKAGGASIFAQEQAALNKIEDLLTSALPVASKEILNSVALMLTDADRILAETANRADGGTHQSLINEGDEERAAGNYPGAVNKYKHAWQKSVH